MYDFKDKIALVVGAAGGIGSAVVNELVQEGINKIVISDNNFEKVAKLAVDIETESGRIGGIATGINYTTSKGGIIAMTMAMAKAGGPYNINVNAVAPGFIDTEMTKDFSHFDPLSVPLRRIGTPKDVANVVTFLASDRSSYITGCTIDINGGVYMC